MRRTSASIGDLLAPLGFLALGGCSHVSSSSSAPNRVDEASVAAPAGGAGSAARAGSDKVTARNSDGGVRRVVSPAALRAAELHARGCAHGSPHDCYEQAEDYRFARTESGTVDYASAATYYRKACDAGVPEACEGLGIAYRLGRGVPHDDAKAFQLFKGACAPTFQDDCNHLADMYWDGAGCAQDRERAKVLWRGACDGDVANACDQLAYAKETSEGDAGRASSLPLLAKAATLYEADCKNDWVDACFRLAEMYDRGRGVPLDLPRAARLYGQACTGLNVGACNRLARMYEKGNGVATDTAEAIRLYRGACESDVAEACAGLARLGGDLAPPR